MSANESDLSVPRGRPDDIARVRKRPSHNGFGMVYGAYNNPSNVADENSATQPSDVAIAPVIRMARPPAPKASPRSKEGSLRSLKLRRSQSSLDSNSEDKQAAKSTILPSGSRSSASAASSRDSRRKHQDRTSQVEPTLPRTISGSSLHPGATQTRPSPSESIASLCPSASTHDVSRETIEESNAENQSGESNAESTNGPSTPALQAQASSSRTALNKPSMMKPSPDSPSSTLHGHTIPSRQSSLRHSFHGSPSKSKSSRHTRYQSSSSREVRVNQDLLEDFSELDIIDDPIAKRIQELKAKMQRNSDQDVLENRHQSRSRSRSSYPGPHSVELSERANDSSSKRSARSSVNVDESLPTKKLAEDLLFDEQDTAPSPTVYSTNKKRNSASLPTSSAPARTSSMLVSQATHEVINGSQQLGVGSHAPGIGEQVKDSRKKANRLSPPGRLSLGLEDRESVADTVDDDVDKFLDSPRLTQKIAHPQTGRIIAFSEVGDPDGFAVICCVGMGLTRYLTAFYDELAVTLKLRLITLDRPGVGESEPCLDGSGTPLTWPGEPKGILSSVRVKLTGVDDVAIVCNHLHVTKFSILAHSAGAIYAMATALRLPQHIRGRLHLMAPWIPPSQMSSFGTHPEPVPAGSMPYSQRILRALPMSFLKAANASFMSANSASITNRLPKSPRHKRRTTVGGAEAPMANGSLSRRNTEGPQAVTEAAVGALQDDRRDKNLDSLVGDARHSKDGLRDGEERRQDYNERLTYAIWEAATANANPAVDLVTCLERRQAIGFRYVDIIRAVVIHHGSKDTRVPVENVKWLGKLMKRCEVRVLDGEGHGLMASASVMGSILTEVAREWEDWSIITQGKRDLRSRKEMSWA